MTAAVLLITAAALLVLQGVTFLVALRVGKHSVVDTAWGIGIALAALAAFLVSLGHGDTTRRALLLAASVLWGLRLAAYVGRRNHGKPEDPRYADMLRGHTNLYALRMVYLLQAAILWLATVPVQLGMLERTAVGPLAVAGAVLFAVGFAFESVGDWQLARFKATRRAGPDHGPRAVALHQAPELLRRLLHVVGAVRHQLRLLARAPGPGRPAADELHPDPRYRRQDDRQADDRVSPAVRRLRRPDQRFHPPPAETGAETECRRRSSAGKGLRKDCSASQPNSPPLA